MTVYAKLNEARTAFHALKLEKTGHNKFAGYDYFELGDFLLPAMRVLAEHGLCAVVSFEKDTATMRIVDVAKPDDCIVITSPMGSAALKGCHEVQNIGAVETYQRRYLWVAAMEIVEHDALDATTGKEKPVVTPEKPIKPTPRGPVLPAKVGIGEDTLTDAEKDHLYDLAAVCNDLVAEGRVAEADKRIKAEELEIDQELFLANNMNESARAAVKAYRVQQRKQAAPLLA